MRVRRCAQACVLVAAAVLGGLTACGVPLQTTAEPLPANVIPAPLRVPTATATATASPQPSRSPEPSPSRLRLWFVQVDGLAAVESTLPEGSSPDLVVQSLAVGPTSQQSAQGLRTVARDPLTGLALVSVAPPALVASPPVPVEPTNPATSPATAPATGPPTDPAATDQPSADSVPTAPASVTVQLAPAFTALPPVEQVLLLGQVVLSLTGAGERSVAFTDETGNPVAVPLPDGRLLDAPATARDYASLIVRP